MKAQLFSTAALILLSAVSGAITTEESNLRGASGSTSEDSFDLLPEDYNLEDYELDFLTDPCNEFTRHSECRNAPRCERVGRTCRQKLSICSGLSRSECNARDRRHTCYFTGSGDRARCQRIKPCDMKDREACNDHSPDCRWDRGGCVRKYEGKSSGPDGPCADMTRNQCDRAKYCKRDKRNVCVPNLLAEA